MIDTSMFTSINLRLYKWTFTEQGFTNVDSPISNYKILTPLAFHIWEHQIFSCSKFIEIVILLVYDIMPVGFSLFGHFKDNTFYITLFGKG